ncbi:MAG: hypothetical protein OEX12_01975 [Gammaproteobacteria bacterium]|nr:hypothetical protein [Gammaproteobacteria bacterium]
MDISQVLQPGQRVTHNESPKDAATSSAAQPTNARSKDNVALSDEAVFLNQLDNGSIEWGRSFTTTPPIPRTLNEIREWVSSYTDGLRSRVEEIFQQQNVDLEQDLTIQVNGNGQLQVDPSHPQAVRAQQALTEHPELTLQLSEQQQRQQLANVLEIGGALRNADTTEARRGSEQDLSQQISTPQAFQLTVAAETDISVKNQAQQA